MYFIQSQSMHSDECRPHFVKASISDGSILFRVPIPQIAEAGRIYDNGKQVRPTGKAEIQNSRPGVHIGIKDRDVLLLLTNDQRFCIWPASDYRIYMFCTGSGNLLHIQDPPRGALSWVRPNPNHSGFWITQRGPFNTERFTIEWPFCFWNLDGDSPIDQPFFNYGLYNILDAAQAPVALRILQGTTWDRNVAGGLDAWQSQKIDPFCTMIISPLRVAEYHARGLPLWMRELVLPNLHPSFLETQEYFGLVQIFAPQPVTLPSRDSRATERRLLEFERPLSYPEEVYDTQAGYLTCWMPSDDHLLIVDFWPNW
ncbi:MAG: hypothetical protein Q9195_007463 [Heterodermia aff. obscurata]